MRKALMVLAAVVVLVGASGCCGSSCGGCHSGCSSVKTVSTTTQG
jgi:hypothetical protein